MAEKRSLHDVYHYAPRTFWAFLKLPLLGQLSSAIAPCIALLPYVLYVFLHPVGNATTVEKVLRAKLSN